MRRKGWTVVMLSGLILSGCVKEIPLIPDDDIPSSEENSSAQVSSEGKTEEATEKTEEATENTEETTPVSSTEEKTEETTETETEETTEHESTTKVVELPTEGRPIGAEKHYGITGLETYKDRDYMCTYNDIYKVGYLAPDAKCADGYISNCTFYDMDDGNFVVKAMLTETQNTHPWDEENTVEGVKKGVLASYWENEDVIGNVNTFFECEDNADIPSAVWERVNKKLWMVRDTEDGKQAEYYDQAAKLRSVIKLAEEATDGSFRDSNDSYYYVQNGLIMYQRPGQSSAKTVQLSEPFYVQKISGVYEYPFGSGMAIVRGVDDTGAETSASVNLDTGEILYIGQIAYFGACQNNKLVLESFANGRSSEVRFYAFGYPDASYTINMDILLKAQLMSDNNIVLWYTTPAGPGTITYHLLKLNYNHKLIASSSFDAPEGSFISGEMLVDATGKIIIPIAAKNGSITFYKWDPVIIQSLEPKLSMATVTDTTKYKK